MALSLEQLQSAFKQNKPTGNNRPNNYYPFWNIKTGEQAIIRFLPDKNPENPMGFLVEKLMHTLTINGENKSVPCLKMYGEDCPICKVSSAYYRDNDEANGKKYWRKKQNLAQCLVIEDPLPPDADTGETHEGKVRFVALGYQLFNVIKEAFEGGELDEVPFSFKDGCNFIIKKTKSGQYDTYAVGSRFARKSSDLTDDEVAEFEDHMIDLSTLLPQHPGVEKVESMMEAALTGAAYEDSSSSTPRPNAMESMVANARPAHTEKAVESTPAQSSSSSDDEYDEEAERILADIRGRKKKKAE